MNRMNRSITEFSERVQQFQFDLDFLKGIQKRKIQLKDFEEQAKLDKYLTQFLKSGLMKKIPMKKVEKHFQHVFRSSLNQKFIFSCLFQILDFKLPKCTEELEVKEKVGTNLYECYFMLFSSLVQPREDRIQESNLLRELNLVKGILGPRKLLHFQSEAPQRFNRNLLEQAEVKDFLKKLKQKQGRDGDEVKLQEKKNQQLLEEMVRGEDEVIQKAKFFNLGSENFPQQKKLLSETHSDHFVKNGVIQQGVSKQIKKLQDQKFQQRDLQQQQVSQLSIQKGNKSMIQEIRVLNEEEAAQGGSSQPQKSQKKFQVNKIGPAMSKVLSMENGRLPQIVNQSIQHHQENRQQQKQQERFKLLWMMENIQAHRQNQGNDQKQDLNGQKSQESVIKKYHLKLNRYEENQFEKKKKDDGKFSHFYKEIRDLELIMKHRPESVLDLPFSEHFFTQEYQLKKSLQKIAQKEQNQNQTNNSSENFQEDSKFKIKLRSITQQNNQSGEIEKSQTSFSQNDKNQNGNQSQQLNYFSPKKLTLNDKKFSENQIFFLQNEQNNQNFNNLHKLSQSQNNLFENQSIQLNPSENNLLNSFQNSPVKKVGFKNNLENSSNNNKLINLISNLNPENENENANTQGKEKKLENSQKRTVEAKILIGGVELQNENNHNQLSQVDLLLHNQNPNIYQKSNKNKYISRMNKINEQNDKIHKMRCNADSIESFYSNYKIQTGIYNDQITQVIENKIYHRNNTQI